MTNPITPPDELVAQLLKEFYGPAIMLIAPSEASLHVATATAQWGADQELEACCEWMKRHLHSGPQLCKQLRAARRPIMPPSLKEQALSALGHLQEDEPSYQSSFDTIRLALEALDD